MFKFESLRVFHVATQLATEIDLIRRAFPDREKYVLAPQIQRAADSVALNIAEGSTGQSDAEFKRFLGFSVRSGIEVVACLMLARKRELIDQQQYDMYYISYSDLIKSIQHLRKSI
jgi:four helix bundle protein